MFPTKQFNAEGAFCEGPVANKVQVVEEGKRELLLQIQDGPSVRPLSKHKECISKQSRSIPNLEIESWQEPGAFAIGGQGEDTCQK